MRIGIDCRIYSAKFTGLGRYTYELVQQFIKLNGKLKNPHELVLFFNNPEFKNFATKPHTQKILVDARHYSLSEQTHFLRKLNQAKLDIVHFPHFNLPLIYNKPFIVTIHDLTLSHFPGRKMTKWYHRLAYNLIIRHAIKKAQKIIAISEHTKKDILENFRIPPSKIQVIYNGISSHFTQLTKPTSGEFPPVHKTLQKYHLHKPFLLYTGVWRNHKNLPRLIEAFKILKNKLAIISDHGHTHFAKSARADFSASTRSHHPLKLVITGKPDPFYPEVKNAVRALHLEHDVIFPGLVDETELVHLYNSAEIFVFPSLYEGFGLPPLESMACGTPVAASNSSSIPEICGTHNAIFFDPHNPEDIAEKIHKLYKDKALQQQLTKNGLSHIQNFSWAKTAKATFNLICSNPSKNS